MHKDKQQTLETHIRMLQDDNLRLTDSIKAKKD